MSFPPGGRPHRTLHIILSCANFAQGLGAFCVLGLLPAITADLSVPAHHAGLPMSVYALVYALSSPILNATLGGFDRKFLLIGGLGVLGAGALVVSMAPDLQRMLLGRFLMATGGGLITPVVGSMAVATSAPEARGRALSLVFAGLPAAQAVGIPLATWVAGGSSWRWSFAGIAAVALLALLAAALKVPSGIRMKAVSLSALREVLSQPRVVVAIAFIVFFVGSNFTLLTYLSAFLAQRYQLDGRGLALVLAIYGSGAFLGNAVGGAMTDRWGATRTLALLCLATMLTLPLLTVPDVPLAALVAGLAVWALCAWSVHPAQQARLSHLDPGRAPILLALHSSALYAGSWAGATLGGQVMARAGSHWLGPAGAALTALALLSIGLAAVPARNPA